MIDLPAKTTGHEADKQLTKQKESAVLHNEFYKLKIKSIHVAVSRVNSDTSLSIC